MWWVLLHIKQMCFQICGFLMLCFDDFHEVAYKYAVYVYIWNRDDMRKWFYGDDYVVLRAPMDDLL